jgi:hypothetical protein
MAGASGGVEMIGLDEHEEGLPAKRGCSPSVERPALNSTS